MSNERKQQIIKAAAKRFIRHGLNKTTLDEIARDIRIGKATIYHYFTSKDELYIETLKWEIETFLEQVKIIFNDETKNSGEKLSDYLFLKENAKLNYKLIFETIQNYFIDKALEKEIEQIKFLLVKEEEIIKKSLTTAYKEKVISISPALPNFVSISSWGLLLETALNELSSPNKTAATKDLIRKSIESLIP